MPDIKITKAEARLIESLVQHYKSNLTIFETLMKQLQVLIPANTDLSKNVHSFKWRTKDPLHLKDKLTRKMKEYKQRGADFDINKENLYTKINDLVGVRILHLYTSQIKDINEALLRLLEAEHTFNLIEGPSARTWDDESRALFETLGIASIASPSMYTSVHYIFEKLSLTKVTFEIQVRTLMEEVWGEVNHTINYPHHVNSVACREQIKVLARVTSSCTRLVDSIFTTFKDFSSTTPAQVSNRRRNTSRPKPTSKKQSKKR
ncbi:MAG TPA: RelA/SpoT domain-containing protein [Blastocatellia bacterium]|nr:RelA/SpoT domain-containing protein [Blastocatellia bacterium]